MTSRSEVARVAAAAVLLLLAAAPAARADDDFFGIGAHATTWMTPDAEDEASLSFGAQVRVRPFRKIAFEGSVGLRDDEFDGGTLDARTIPLQASVLFFLLSGRVDAYLLGGVTYLVVDVDDELLGGDDVTRIPGFHAGGGVQVKIYGPWRVHADARYLVANDDVNGRALDFDGFQLHAGISFWF